MKIGILSDTHGNIKSTQIAVEQFRATDISVVFHCGDIGSDCILSELAVLDVPVHVVLGNVDVYSDEWKFFPVDIGIQLHGRFGDIMLGDQRIALLHGDDQRQLNHVISSEEYTYVFTGHTHAVHDVIENRTRCINPGTAGRGIRKTCAVLDFDSGQLDVMELNV